MAFYFLIFLGLSYVLLCLFTILRQIAHRMSALCDRYEPLEGNPCRTFGCIFRRRSHRNPMRPTHIGNRIVVSFFEDVDSDRKSTVRSDQNVYFEDVQYLAPPVTLSAMQWRKIIRSVYTMLNKLIICNEIKYSIAKITELMYLGLDRIMESCFKLLFPNNASIKFHLDLCPSLCRCRSSYCSIKSQPHVHVHCALR